MRVGKEFGAEAFERAFEGFRELYNVAPVAARCSPDVLDRYAQLFERRASAANTSELRYRGVPLFAAVLPPGTMALEGEVDEDRMGDW